MKRLRDQTSSSDPLTARAAALLSAMPPLDTSQLHPRTLPARASGYGAGLSLRTGVVLAVALGTFAATAAATLHTWPLHRTTERPPVEGASGIFRPVIAPTPPEAPPEARPEGRAGPPAHWVEVADPKGRSPATTDNVARGAATESGGRTTATAAGPSEPSRGPSKAPVPSSVTSGTSGAERELAEDESSLIVRAVRALRREGDPARARALAEQALARFPHGAQVEEAMALAMEAAFSSGDVTGAQLAASAYRDRYPSGRFADRAERILASTAR